MRGILLAALLGTAVPVAAHAALDAQQQARFDRDMAEGRAKFESGMARASVKDLVIAIREFSDALKVEPDDAEAKDKRDPAKAKRASILAIVVAADVAEKAKRAGAMFQDAVDAKQQRRYEQAVDKFQRVIDYDPANDFGFSSQAQQQIASIKGQLAQQAAPYRQEGKAAFDRQDFIAARTAYRQAISIDPYDQTLVLELQPIELQCQKKAQDDLRELRRSLPIRLRDGSQMCPWP